MVDAAIAALLVFSGVVLLALDVKTFLGHGVVALLGLALGVWGVWLAMEQSSTLAVVGIVTASLALALVAAVLLLRSDWVKGLVLQGAIVAEPSEIAAEPALVGRRGLALTDLRPSGVARIDGRRLDVVADNGAYLSKDTPVEVVRIAQNSLIVRQVT